jgi:uncharacterized protein YfaP (DUF2135 family)
MVVAILLILLFQPFSYFIHSQQSKQIAINPVMKISNLRNGTENPMRLDRLNIDIKIIGQIAITTLDMTYYNPNSRVMEGEFNFPLGEGQTVSRFALDINGILREGVVVEKEQGLKTFEAIVRRGVDPGLLEMTQGNNFRMRIYPLPAKGARRVVLAFEQELTDKGTSDLYILPLKINESIAKFSVHAEVIKNNVKLDTENNELSNLSFNKWNDSYVANFEQDNFVPDKKIAFLFPHTSNAERVFSAAKDNHSDSSYFYVNIRPKSLEQIKVLPKRITLLWDNSNSAQDLNLEKELAILDKYIQKIGNLTIEFVPFNIKTGKTETFEITGGNWDKLKSALKSIVYDGGTSLGCLDFTKFKSDEILLFSDGMTTFGNAEPKFSHTPVYTLNSNVTANPMFLTYVAQHSGGVHIDLNKFSNEEVVAKLTNNNYHFISAQIQNGQVSDVYPSMPCQFNNTFSLVGTMRGKSATLVLNFGFGSTITYSKAIEINADNSTDQAILSRLWAEKKIAELSLNEEKHKDEITLTGKNFGIVTPNTSLIVLENLSDYLQNNIVPPVEMREEYFRQKAINEKESNEKIKNHIEYVVGLSNDQSKWWNKNFLYTPATKSIKRKHRRGIKFTAPVIKKDEEMKSQEELDNSRGVISIADVKGNDDTNGRDIADVKGVIVEGYNKDVVQQASIQLNAWDPQTPYLKVLQYAPAGTEYTTYLKLKKEYGSTPAFYIDAADFFSKSGKKNTAVTILSNLAELRLESPQLLRVLGNKLLDFKCTAEAVTVFKKVLKLKGEEPQSYRDLGLAYEANGEFQQGINTLYEVLKKEWDNRFPGIELIAMNEINNIIATHRGLESAFIDKRLLKKEPIDIRVSLTWDTDNCDMDLWVTDPNGEKCFYKHQLTRIGGKISNDFTDGYGPEEFMIKKALNGQYLVQANYYGTRSQSQLAPVNLHLVFITNFGKPNQKKQEVTIRLENKEDVINVGKFSFITPIQQIHP